MSVLSVTSEIKTLRKVLLHRPGAELLHLTPDTLGELLFDDIPFLQVAQAEHDAFAKILRDNGAEVLYLEDLAAEAIKKPEIRTQFIEQFINESDVYSEKHKESIRELLNNIKDNKQLILKTMEGIDIKENLIEKYNLYPTPEYIANYSIKDNNEEEILIIKEFFKRRRTK